MHTICSSAKYKGIFLGAAFIVTMTKRKFIALLAIVVLGGGVITAISPGETAGQKPPTTQPVENQSEESLFNNSNSLFKNDPNLLGGSDGSLTTRKLFYRMMFAVFFVIVLGVAVIYIFKKFVPKITNLAGRKIRIIETAHLGQRKTLYLLKIGSRELLIGSTNENITMLADVSDNESSLEPPVVLSETDMLKNNKSGI